MAGGAAFAAFGHLNHNLQRPLIVLGTGGHACVVVDLATAAGIEVMGCVGPGQPRFPASFCRYLGPDEVLETFDAGNLKVAVGVGSTSDAALRSRLFAAARARRFDLPALVHPRASTGYGVTLGAGAQVMAGAVINAFAAVGENAIINSGAIVEHHAGIGAHAHIAPGAIVCGEARIGASAHVGAGAMVLQNVVVGEGAVVGAGAVVTRDVAPSRIVKGVPAK